MKICTTNELGQLANILLDCDFSTPAPKQQGSSINYREGQILTISKTFSDGVIRVIMKFRYIGNDEWEQIET